MGHSVDILNYQNKTLRSKYDSKLRMQLRFRDIRHPKLFLKKLQFIYNIPKYQEIWKKQCEHFETFIEMFLLEGNKKEYILEDIQNMNKDIFIVGSDQVWTSGITGGLDPVYLLDFPTKARKISYAASIYGGSIPKSELPVFQRCLADFEKISVREGKLAESIQKACNYPVVTVLDPTLLLNAEKYEELICTERLCENKYLLAYFVTDQPILANAAKAIAEYLQLRLIEIHYYKKETENKDYVADAGPAEFLWYIKHSEYILTNSFHGTVFSILFSKNFYSIYGEDARMDHLLNQLGLASRHIVNLTENIKIEPVDYKNVGQNLDYLRKASEEFLTESLQ